MTTTGEHKSGTFSPLASFAQDEPFSPLVSPKTRYGSSISPRTVTASIEPGFTAPLLAQTAETRELFDAWVGAQKARADGARKAHTDLVNKEQGVIDEMHENLRKVRADLGVIAENGDREESVARRAGRVKERLEELEFAIEEIRLGTREKQRDFDGKKFVFDYWIGSNNSIFSGVLNGSLLFPFLCRRRLSRSELSRVESVQRARVEDIRIKKNRTENIKKVTLEDLTFGQLKYHWLGLCFRKTEEDGLRFAFTQIDRDDPDRIFAFTLKVNDEDDAWEVEECNPPLKAGALIRLVDTLNTSGEPNDIGGFVRGMRECDSFWAFLVNN